MDTETVLLNEKAKMLHQLVLRLVLTLCFKSDLPATRVAPTRSHHHVFATVTPLSLPLAKTDHRPKSCAWSGGDVKFESRVLL